MRNKGTLARMNPTIASGTGRLGICGTLGLILVCQTYPVRRKDVRHMRTYDKEQASVVKPTNNISPGASSGEFTSTT